MSSDNTQQPNQAHQQEQQAAQLQAIPEYVPPPPTEKIEAMQSAADVQIIIKEAYKEKSAHFTNFFNDYGTEYKLLKKITHECQVKCYGNEKFTVKESESCARSCLRPYLTFKKVTGEKLQNCQDLFQQGESKCVSNNLDTQQCYKLLNEKLYQCLKKYAGFYKKSYENIFKDFDSIVEF